MKSAAKDVEFEPLDSIFKPREMVDGEQVIHVPLSELYAFKDHPFKVVDDDKMRDLTASIEKSGVYDPAIVRPRAEGGFEIVAGHRRKHASELAGKDTLPVIVRNLDDDAATILMADSNLQQRDTILPSERAFAYKMKLEAMKRLAGRPSKENLSPVGTNLRGQRSDQILADQVGESRNQVQRYIRLTELVPPLLAMVDEGSVAFRPAVELSYLKKEEQQTLLDVMESEQTAPSVSQAQRLKKFSQDGKLDRNSMEAIMTEEKPEVEKLTIRGDKLRKTFSGLFPRDATPQQMEDTIVKALAHYQKFQQQNRQQHKTHARDMAR